MSVLDTLFSYSQLRPLKFLHCKLLRHLLEEHFPCCHYFCCFVFSRTRRSNSGRWQREELTVSFITMVRDEQILPCALKCFSLMFLFSPWDIEKCNLDVFAYLVQVGKLKSEPLNHKVKREVTLKMVNVVVGAAAWSTGNFNASQPSLRFKLSHKEKKIQCAAVVRITLPCWCQGPEFIMGRLAGDHREATVSRKTSQATMKRKGKKKPKKKIVNVKNACVDSHLC